MVEESSVAIHCGGRRRPRRWIADIAAVLPSLLIVSSIGCAAGAKLRVVEGSGPEPHLPPPHHSVLPTVDVVTATGWPAGLTPTAAAGLRVARFAEGLEHPRWLHVLPNGDVLVAETNAPPRPDDNKGVKGWFFKRLQKKAGGAVPSPDRITLLRDTDGDGVADARFVFLSNLTSPFGMALIGETLYVANTDAIVRVPYTPGMTQAAMAPETVVELPAGPINHHWTKSLIASPDGTRLYVGVGSNSNAAENGINQESERAAVWEVDPERRMHRVFASGLRNPVGLAWEPDSGKLWVAVNERDELGGDLVPDFMTGLEDGAFYGWPYSYFGSHVDKRVSPQRPDLVAKAVIPDYALGPHTASLGLAYSGDNSLAEPFRHGMFVGQHGSWNRKPRSGYKVIFVAFKDGRPVGAPLDVLTDFVAGNGDAMGRPVGVAIDRRGALLVADDVGNTIWRVTASPRVTTQ
jgi:glucose/arabinose dehydrogenase